MAANITITELLGKDFKEFNYAVTSNWRISFEHCPELKTLIGNNEDISMQLSFACHSDFQFETNIEYADATIKGIHISQAAWQDRFIESLTLDVYESMDHRLFKGLVTAANNTAGYFNGRDIGAKSSYTLSGIQLIALGNSDSNGAVKSELVYQLEGVQINSVQSPNYTSDSADIASVQLDLRAHGWTLPGVD